MSIPLSKLELSRSPERELRSIDTSIVRALAVLLVTNSHLEAFYPLPFLADGGLIGLALFFAASGFGLAVSPRTRSEPFGAWMWRRVKRIYPAVLLTVLLLGLGANGYWRSWDAWDYVKQFVYPTQYHFVAKILVFYPVLYVVLRLGAGVNRKVLTPVLLIAIGVTAWPDVMALYADPIPLRTGRLNPLFLWLVFLAMTLLGAVLPSWLRRRAEDENTSKLTLRDWLILAGLFAGYAVCKLAMAKFGVLPWLFPVYFVIGTALAMQLFCAAAHPQLVDAVRARAWMWVPVSTLSAISLEVYLVHIQMVYWPQWQRLVFPLNILVFVGVSVVVAYGVKRGVKKGLAVVGRRSSGRASVL